MIFTAIYGIIIFGKYKETGAYRMKIIKRNGSEVVFDISKIIAAIEKANVTVPEEERLNQPQILDIASTVEKKCIDMHRAPSVEEIQEMVETRIMECGAFEVAKR